MTVVIDVGCARYDGDYSIERLIAEFQPDMVYGFDPSLNLTPPEGAERVNETRWLLPDGTGLALEQKAAWIYDGEIGLVRDGLSTHVTNGPNAEPVRCFDLARFIATIHDRDEGQEIVLKIDAEMAEYDLLEHLIRTGTDKLLKLAWVEWHCLTCGRGAGGHREGCRGRGESEHRRMLIEQQINCELAEWRW